ncbi:MAG: phospholipid carrier-dependent glycosyltransferase [Deltaproteobacteria bacterium]|nr:phospholipid carrier-dependent glycosyltransferase [Deltaproteobacteria bacterium]
MRLATVLVLTVIAGWLRFTSLDFGLPDKFRPDEEYMVSRAVGFSEDLNPHFTVYPAAQMYVHHATLRLIAALEGQKGDFRGAFLPGGFARAHLVGRQLAAAFGTATIPAIYWAALPAYGSTAALASATVMTFATIHVRESKYSTTDTAAVFWLTLAIGMMLRVILRGGLGPSLLAGVFTGIAMATKYPTGAVLAGQALAHLGARWREGRSLWRSFRDIRPWITLVTTIVVFVCCTPYFLLDWAQTLNDFAYQRGFLEQGVGNTRAGWGWSWLLEKALPDGLGPELATVVLVAVAWCVIRPRIGTWSLLAFVAVATLGMTSSRYAFYRYVVIPLPALVLFVGILASDVKRWLARRVPDPWPAVVLSAALLVLLVPSAIRDYKLGRIFARRDTRTIAREWIQEHVPPGSAIAMTNHATPYGKPQLTAGGYRIEPFQDVATLRRGQIRWVLSDSDVLPFYSPAPTDAQLRELESSADLRFDLDPVKPGTPKPVFDEADAFYIPIRHTSSMKRPGPRIRIWELRDGPAAPAEPPPSTKLRRRRVQD